MKFLSVLLAAALLTVLIACSDLSNIEEVNTLTVYFPYTESAQNSGELIGGIDIPVPQSYDLLHKALTELGKTPSYENMVSPFAGDVRVYSYTVSDGVLSLFLTPGYKNMPDASRSILNACLTLTLCGLEEVDSILIHCADSDIAVELSESSFIMPSTQENEYEKQFTVYFADKDNSFLEREYRILTIGQDKPLAEYVLDELLRGPQNIMLSPTIPEGTRVLSVEVKKKVCTVDLSDEFLANMPKTAAGERMALYSIVNSLTELSGIDAVQLTINGIRHSTYNYIPINMPFHKNNSIIGPVSPDGSETETVFYYGHPRLRSQIIAYPVIIKTNNNTTAEQNIIEHYLELSPPFGCTRLIPEGTKLLSVVNSNREIRITLSTEFRSETGSELAETALILLASSYGSADSVRIFADNTELSSSTSGTVEIVY